MQCMYSHICHCAVLHRYMNVGEAMGKVRVMCGASAVPVLFVGPSAVPVLFVGPSAVPVLFVGPSAVPVLFVGHVFFVVHVFFVGRVVLVCVHFFSLHLVLVRGLSWGSVTS